MEQISKLLNTYEEVPDQRRKYVKRVKNNQIIRAWNFLVEGKSPEENDFREGTDYNAAFLRGYREAKVFMNSGDAPGYTPNLLHKEAASCRRTIKECMRELDNSNNPQ